LDGICQIELLSRKLPHDSFEFETEKMHERGGRIEARRVADSIDVFRRLA
jgi:hypothetical protein